MSFGTYLFFYTIKLLFLRYKKDMKKETNRDVYTHILKCISVFGSVQGLNILVGLMRNKLVAVILGPAGMGLVSLFNSTIKLVSDTTNLGISTSAVKMLSESYEKQDEAQLKHHISVVRLWCILTGVVGSLLCAVFSHSLDSFTFPLGGHTLDFVLLSPIIAFTAIMGGELAILKSTRQLKNLAKLSVYGAVVSLVLSVPLYYVWREQAIVPSLVLVALVQMLITIAYSYRQFPLRITGFLPCLGGGKGMVRLGMAFVLAGILTSGSEYMVRSYLNHVGDLSIVGLYNSSYAITVVYAGMIFQAMDTDYFPRLSAVGSIGDSLNFVVNSQVEVTILLLSPMLVLFIIFVPILLPLLYSSDFLSAVGIMRISILAMYFRAFSLPIEYIPLSRGDSRIFLFSELFGALCMLLFVIGGYQLANTLGVSGKDSVETSLTGMGAGLALFGLVNLLFELLYSRCLYGYKPSRKVVKYLLLQVPLGILVCVAAFMFEGVWGILLQLLVALASLSVSWSVFRKNTHLLSKIKDKLYH